MMKRVLINFFIILCSLVLCGCSPSITVNKQVIVEGSIFGGTADSKISLDAKFNTSWVSTNDNKIYNADLASFCSLASTDIYFRQKDLDRNIQNRVLIEGQDIEYNEKTFLESFGYKDVEIIDTSKKDNFFVDTNDTNVFLIGHQVVDRYENFVVVLRGTFSSNEWLSDFDIGNDELVYETINGPHIDWKHKYIYKGIDVTATRIKKYINEYIEKYDNKKISNTILLTGHSRGASIANVLGASYEDEGQKSYTYTFGAMPVIEKSHKGDYKTIFNIYDDYDYANSIFQYQNDEFVLFGTNKTSNLEDDKNYLKEYEKLMNKKVPSYLSEDEFLRYREIFSNYFKDRKNIYDIVSLTKEFNDMNEAVTKRNEIIELISNKKQLDCEKYCNVQEIKRNSDGKFQFDIVYSKGAMLVCLSKVLAFGETQYKNTINVFEEDRDIVDLFKAIYNNIDIIKSTHIIVNDYIIANLK